MGLPGFTVGPEGELYASNHSSFTDTNSKSNHMCGDVRFEEILPTHLLHHARSLSVGTVSSLASYGRLLHRGRGRQRQRQLFCRTL